MGWLCQPGGMVPAWWQPAKIVSDSSRMAWVRRIIPDMVAGGALEVWALALRDHDLHRGGEVAELWRGEACFDHVQIASADHADHGPIGELK